MTKNDQRMGGRHLTHEAATASCLKDGVSRDQHGCEQHVAAEDETCDGLLGGGGGAGGARGGRGGGGGGGGGGRGGGGGGPGGLPLPFLFNWADRSLSLT
jgi:hypothetical protein